jgi:hypothetical protein
MPQPWGLPMKSELYLTFPTSSAAEKSRLVSGIEDALREVEGISTKVVRENPESMDPGTILSIVLAAPSVVLAVKAISKWLARNNQSGISITLPNGQVVMTNMKSDDVAAAISALNGVLKT